MTMDIFTRTQAARFLQSHGLRTTAASLATMATRGGGPRFLKFGRYAQYRRCDLLEWMSLRCSGLLDSTSTPSNGNTGGLFAYEPDNGDLEDEWDYRNTGDRFFDEVTRLEEAGELDAMIQAAGERHHHFDLR
jgi:hypothetical protein